MVARQALSWGWEFGQRFVSTCKVDCIVGVVVSRPGKQSTPNYLKMEVISAKLPISCSFHRASEAFRALSAPKTGEH